ncbi:MAG TPA: tetratricopeptide repeat protein [Bryobacteraceae bacterium]|nr:tetratricopeptide repeat protein [Bryobacteraceae bacterium]
MRSVVLFFFAALLAFAQKELEQAVTLARQGHYAEAEKALAGVSEPDDLNRRIAFHRLKAAVDSGVNKPQLAVEEMHFALALAPGNPDLVLATAVAELAAGQIDASLADAHSVPESPQQQALLGDIQEKKGDHVAAATAYEKAVQLAPDREEYRIAFGLELIKHQSFQPAIDLLETSDRLFPKSAKLRTLLGIAQYSAGYTEDAVHSLEDAISLDRTLDAPHRCLGEILLQSSAAPSEAAKTMLCAWSKIVCSALQLRTARRTGDATLTAQAIAELKRAPAESAIGRCELGRAYEWNGNLHDARREMEACVRLDPSPQNHYRLALLYRRLDEPELAHKEMELRTAILARMSDETAVGLNALKGFEYSAR